MPLLVNSAGGTAADPLLEDLPIALIGGADSLDLAASIRAWIDQVTGTGTNEVTAALSPDPTTVFLQGADGTYTAASRTLAVGSVTGITAGNFIYVDNGTVATVARIQSVDAVANSVVLTESVFAANATGVAYAIQYVWEGAATELGALRATAAGQVNFWKFQGADAFGNLGSAENTIYGRLDPTGSAFIEIQGGNFTGQTITTFTPTFDILPTWANRGGIATLELITPSGMQWWDATTGEKTLSSILAQLADARLALTGTDGLKSATLRLRTLAGSAAYRDVAISVTVNTSAPNIILSAAGR